MPLDPQVKTFLDQLAAAAIPPVETLSPREARLQMEAGTLMLGRLPEVGRVQDVSIPGPAGPLRARLTVPAEAATPSPAVVYFHGGGFVCGSVYSHDHLCRALTNAARVAVLSVDYRLAPENPFPAPVEDAEAATVWAAAHAPEVGIDPEKLAVGGDSAGGNLAAVVALRLRDRGGPALAAQLLLYPATDSDFDTPSYLENADGYLLTRAAMMWYWDQYVPDPARRTDPDASPLRAGPLEGLPPAVVVTAEYDPLRDEGEAYAHKLAVAGVPVRLLRYDGMIHGFLRRHHLLSRGKSAMAEVGEALRAAMGVSSS
ncbi:MAG: alpha/beta hydrolase [Isosphaeraceae bacterium]